MSNNLILDYLNYKISKLIIYGRTSYIKIETNNTTTFSNYNDSFVNPTSTTDLIPSFSGQYFPFKTISSYSIQKDLENSKLVNFFLIFIYYIYFLVVYLLGCYTFYTFCKNIYPPVVQYIPSILYLKT